MPQGAEVPKFRNDMAVPPGGVYFYAVETATGPVHFEAPHMHLLTGKIIRFCNVNSLPVPGNLEATIQAYMCPRIPDGFCTTPGSKESIPGLTLAKVKDFTRLIATRAFARATVFLVPQDEAERRAKICVECPKNSSQDCTVCHGLLQLVRQLVGRRETKYDAYLGTCALCSCLLRVKVHVSAEALRVATQPPERSQLPPNCWLRNVYYAEGGEGTRHG